MYATIVTTEEELLQILELSKQNQKSGITEEERKEQGFISWNYSIELLKKMHELHPNVIVKDGDKVAGYALVAFKEARHFHPEMDHMIQSIDDIIYNGKPLSSYNYYVMGQVCVDKAYRGKGIFDMLYLKHKELFQHRFDFVETEISTSNKRSVRAHERIGFKTIETHRDEKDEWSIVVWNWQ
ncbi:MAG TPA: GNAT family N-acetyltransferase [Panacibacter sp.]|nr:GNAT family N-acetyltransferase [Panacibacter sp.]